MRVAKSASVYGPSASQTYSEEPASVVREDREHVTLPPGTRFFPRGIQTGVARTFLRQLTKTHGGVAE